MIPTPGTHRGIELRARIVNFPPGQQEILHANSDALHFIAELGSMDWAETLPPVLDAYGKPWLIIEHRAALIPDEYPDDELDDLKPGDILCTYVDRDLSTNRRLRCGRAQGHEGRHSFAYDDGPIDES